jgi:hypothetical protein
MNFREKQKTYFQETFPFVDNELFELSKPVYPSTLKSLFFGVVSILQNTDANERIALPSYAELKIEEVH